MATRRGSTALDDATEAVLIASRALVGVAVRSLNSVAITLPQYRALVVLSEHGEQKVSDLAEHLGIHPSTATRLCDRLDAAGLIDRATAVGNRREVTVALSTKGRSLVRRVSTRRREELRRIVAELVPSERTALVAAFTAFAAAAGETPDDAWQVGWTA